MILIAHRGNINGKNPEQENSFDYIDSAISQGYDVEVDLRFLLDNFYLGHSVPQYLVDKNYLIDRIDKLWVHCKDRQSFDFALEYKLNCFYHNKDDYTITSKGIVWAYPGIPGTRTNCVMVLPEIFWPWSAIKTFSCYGICSDHVGLLKE